MSGIRDRIKSRFNPMQLSTRYNEDHSVVRMNISKLSGYGNETTPYLNDVLEINGILDKEPVTLEKVYGTHGKEKDKPIHHMTKWENDNRIVTQKIESGGAMKPHHVFTEIVTVMYCLPIGAYYIGNAIQGYIFFNEHSYVVNDLFRQNMIEDIMCPLFNSLLILIPGALFSSILYEDRDKVRNYFEIRNMEKRFLPEEPIDAPKGISVYMKNPTTKEVHDTFSDLEKILNK